jgi:hypothetical protein
LDKVGNTITLSGVCADAAPDGRAGGRAEDDGPAYRVADHFFSRTRLDGRQCITNGFG